MDKQKVAASFSAAAASYDSLAQLQKDVGRKLLAAVGSFSAENIVDIGCGTGWMTRQLRLKYPDSLILGADLAPGMIGYARAHQPDAANSWWVADMETLPFPDGEFDLVYSNLAMQWLDSPLVWFQEAFRILKPGGRLLCSTLLPGTLFELEEAWGYADGPQRAEGKTHVNRFTDKKALQQRLELAGFSGEIIQFRDVRYYPSVREIMKELKGIGAHNLNSDRPRTITGKGRIRRMLDHYDLYLTEQGYPTTYEVALLAFNKP